MFRQLRLLQLVIILCLPASSWAVGYFEPNISYSQGSYGIKATSTVDDTLSTQGLTLGARFGGVYDYLYLVLDAKATFMNFAKGDSTFFTDDDTSVFISAGAGIGVDWNIPIRTTLTMDLNNSVSPFDVDFSASGYRAIVSYYFNPDFLINFEYQAMDQTANSELSGSTVETEQTLTVISVGISFPFEFTYPQTSWKNKRSN